MRHALLIALFALVFALPLASPVAVIGARPALADSRLAGARYGSGGFKSGFRVFGAKALHDFAESPQKSSKFAKAYARLAIPSLLVLLAASLLV